MTEEDKTKHTRALELDKILKMLAEQTACEDAAQAALSLKPSPDDAEHLLQETDDAFVLIAKFGSPSFGGLANVTNSLRRAEAGSTLTMAELLKIAVVLRTLRGITEWRQKCGSVKTSLDSRFSLLTPNQYLENRIETAIISDEEMADSASPALAEIRRKIKQSSLRARESLEHITHSQTYQKYLQEPIVTIRDGRFVVPVKSEYRNVVPGLVHDTSASGSTLFIEPMSAVEANNQVQVLLSEEKQEIERVLSELSAEAGNFADTIIRSYGLAVQLNVIFAKASLAYQMKATKPKLNSSGRIVLHQARHPLINPAKVVPTDIELGTRFDTLVITGPNTGGKTVALKTVGLLTLMAMCGLLIPAEEDSEISTYQQVLADIGDEQSIEQSLSTFSAHMKNIIGIMACADQDSLVLLDELGAGTDPVEGAALAESILEALRRKGAKIAATTHYAELKAYALQTAGVENACCEFDVATLRPTYRLLIGMPGRSNAFAISLRLGMDKDVVQHAEELVSGENRRFEDVVKSLEESRRALEEERSEAQEAREKSEQACREAEEARDHVRAEADKQMEEARRKAGFLVDRTRAQINGLLNEMEDLKKQKNKALSAEQKAQLHAGMRTLEDTADPVGKKKKDSSYRLPRPLKIGDSVLIYDIDKKATVLRLPSKDSNDVLVQAGILQTHVPISNLRLLKEEQKKPSFRTVTKDIGRSNASATTEVDVRGETAEEALMDVDRALDAAVLSGVSHVTVIHGKGTGVLRSAVQQHLRRHPSVKSFRLGTFGEGESGVTIVEMK